MLKWTLVTTLLAATLLAAPVAAVTYTLVPEQPVAGQPWQVRVAGELTDSCWSVHAQAQWSHLDTLGVEVTLLHEDFGGGCLMVITPYEVEFDFPAMPAGLHVLVVREVRIRGPLTTGDEIIEPLTITDFVAADYVTWSTLKAVYRR